MTKTRLIILAPGLAGLLFLAACGDTTSERAATGGMGGLVVAGPVGAAVGATAGAVTAE